jgi:DNA-binding SARP family transcriptional activator
LARAFGTGRTQNFPISPYLVRHRRFRDRDFSRTHCIDVENALAAGHAALRIGPLQELIQQRVIELYRASGQHAAAIRQYERLTALLRSELGIAPSKNTRALVDGIRAVQRLEERRD